MKQWEIRSFGALSLAERDDPAPGYGEALVRVRAVSLNYRDLLLVDGSYNPRLPLPAVPCSDMVGEVTAVGHGVTRVRVGDRVIGSFAQRWRAGRLTRSDQLSALSMPLPGVLCTHRVFPEEGIVPAPAHMDDAEASTLPCAALTAWHALVDHGRLTAGETVLVQGTGGVSVFALQIARMLGAQVIATTGKAEKVARLIAFGARHVIDYKVDAEWGKTAKQLTHGVGVDHVVEVGGGGTMAQSLRAVAPGGSVYVIGVLAGNAEPLNVLSVLMNEVRLQGVFVGPRASLEAMCNAFSANAVRPVVDRVFPFEEAPAAMAHLRSGAHFGKVVIAVG